MTAGYSNLGPSRSCSCHFNNKHANIIPARPSHPAPPQSPGSLCHSLTLSRLWYELNDSSDASPRTKGSTARPRSTPSFPPLKAGGTARGTALQPHYYQHGGRWLPHCCFSMSECVCGVSGVCLSGSGCLMFQWRQHR